MNIKERKSKLINRARLAHFYHGYNCIAGFYFALFFNAKHAIS